MPEVKLLKVKGYGDERGEFYEAYNERACLAAGLPTVWKQDNVSRSRGGVIRGLHAQWPNPQAKLIWVVAGTVMDYAVDIRTDSPRFGQFVGAELSSANHQQLYIPEGFAHGFQVLSEEAVVCYKCNAFYAPANEITIRWDDPTIAISWRMNEEPIVSEKDQSGRFLKSFGTGELPLLGSGGPADV